LETADRKNGDRKTKKPARRPLFFCPPFFCHPLAPIFLSSVFLSTRPPRPARLAAGLQTALDQTVRKKTEVRGQKSEVSGWWSVARGAVWRDSRRQGVRRSTLQYSITPVLQLFSSFFRFAVGPRRKSRYLPAAINHQPLTMSHAF
jgi:hypothetical protein